jgi:hypothetical protein
MLTTTIVGMGRIGEITMAGNPTTGSSLKAAMVSRVMYRAHWTAHSSFCSRRIAPAGLTMASSGKDADDLSPAFDLSV